MSKTKSQPDRELVTRKYKFEVWCGRVTESYHGWYREPLWIAPGLAIAQGIFNDYLGRLGLESLLRSFTILLDHHGHSRPFHVPETPLCLFRCRSNCCEAAYAAVVVGEEGPASPQSFAGSGIEHQGALPWKEAAAAARDLDSRLAAEEVENRRVVEEVEGRVAEERTAPVEHMAAVEGRERESRDGKGAASVSRMAICCMIDGDLTGQTVRPGCGCGPDRECGDGVDRGFRCEKGSGLWSRWTTVDA